MDAVLFILGCLAIASVGAWEVAKHKNDKAGKLPEDIQ